MSPAFGWLLALGTCYPWLLAAELLSDMTAAWHLGVFLSGAVLVTPFLRLRTWQAVLLAACVGMAFESRRPIQPGWAAFGLMALSVVAISWRDRLRSKPAWLATATLNMLACLIAFPASLPVSRTWEWSQWAWAMPLQLLVAGLAGAALHRPMTGFQSLLLERWGVHEIREP